PFSTLCADEKSEEAAKQKATALGNLKKLNLEQVITHDTDDLFLCGNIPEKQLKSLGDALQKDFLMIQKTVKFDEKDKPFAGKITLYLFDKKAQYASFVRLVKQDRPESKETSTYVIDRDNAYIAMIIDSSDPFLKQECEAASQLGIVVLERKAGPELTPS